MTIPRTPGRLLKRLWLLLGAVLMSGAVLLALAPTLAASLGRGFIAGRIAAAVNGTVTIRALSLGWFGQQRVEGLEMRDASGQTTIAASAVVDNGILDLLIGSVDMLRVEVEGSIRARLRPDGSVSVADLGSSSTTTSAPAPSGAPLAIPFPRARLTVKRLDLQLDDDAGVAMALRDLRGFAEVGRGTPLQAEFSGTTQVRGQSGQVTLKASLNDLLSRTGSPDLTAMSGRVQAAVSGFVLPVAGVPVQVQSASLTVQAEAGKPIAVDAQSQATWDEQPFSAQLAVQLARPAPGSPPATWATDPRSWSGTVTVRNLPSTAVQPWLVSTPLVATRDFGSTIDLSIQGGAGAAMLQISAQHLQVSAGASVDVATGAVQSREGTATIDLDPALLASLGVQVTMPGRMQVRLSRFETPPIGSAGLDVSALSVEGTITVDPMAVMALAPEPVQLAVAASFRSPALGESIESAWNASVQRQPIELSMQVTGLGPTLDPSAAHVQGTLTAGPLDPELIPGLPATLRSQLLRAGLGASTVRASLAGSATEGAGQLQADTQAGTVALKALWDASSLQVAEFSANLLLQPAVVSDVAGGRVTLTQPASVQVTAGPARMVRSGSVFDLTSLAAIPVSVTAPSIDLGAVQGVCSRASARSLKAQGNLSPRSGPLFDGTVSLEGASLMQVTNAGDVQVNRVVVQGTVGASVGQLTATVESVACARVPGLSAPIRLDAIRATMDGPLVPAEGTRLEVRADIRDAAASLASAQARFEQLAAEQELGLDLTQVDMRRVLSLLGSAQEVPEWVGTKGDRTLAARVRTAQGAATFSLQASLDPVVAQVQGTRSADGTISLGSGSVQATLPAGVVKSLLDNPDSGVSTRSVSDVPLQITLGRCTLPADASGSPQVLGKGSAIEAAVQVSPWKLDLIDGTALDFGAMRMELKMRAASATSLRVSGQLAKRGGTPSPMDIALETATLLDGQGRVDLKRGSIAANVRIEDFPSSVADRLLGMDGYLVDMLGNVVSVRMSGRSGSAPDQFFQGSITSPALQVTIPQVRLSEQGLSVLPQKPIVAELRPDERLRTRILRPLNPIFADMRTANDRPIRATLTALQVPLPVDMAALDGAFDIDVGEVELQKSSQVLQVLDLVKAQPGGSVPARIGPLQASIVKGLLTYRDFQVQIGRLGNGTWQQTLFNDARINLASTPPYADAIDIRYPYSGVVNTAAKLPIPGVRRFLDGLQQQLGGDGKALNAVQMKVKYSGPLDGSELRMDIYPLELPPGMGGRVIEGLQEGIGGALDDLFGGRKK
ncbi:MAG: hypothetical protein RLZZ558_1266 [Planctomycetota bacterium]